jgi:PKD repeat protein
MRSFAFALLLLAVSSAWAGPIVPRKGDRDMVPRYEIYEIAVKLPAEGKDPFADVEVSASFTSPSGKRYQVGGFYAGSGEWRIRFAPSEVGKWSYRYAVTPRLGDGGGDFTCVASSNPGFLRQNPQNKYTWAFDNGQPFWPIGIQDCVGAGPHGDPFEDWALEGGDRDGPWTAAGTSADQYLDAYAQAGFNLFRFSPSNCSYSHYDNLDTYRLVEMAWTDELMQKLRDRGYRIFYGFIGYANAFIKEPDDAAKMEKVKRYLKYSVDRWGAYVDFWELLNEQNADPKWTALMAEYVKSIDPYHHPITDWEQGAAPAIDFYSPHWYEREIEEGSDAITADKAAEWKQQYGKPIIVGEQGNYENVWDYGSARRMRYRLWGALFNEMSFVFWNTSYARNGHYMNIYLGPEERQYTRALQTFSSCLDAGMKMTPVERSSKRFRVHALASEQRVAVYLRNRFGEKTKGDSITLTVPKAGYGYWLAPDTMHLLGSFRVGAGEQKIEIPDLRHDLALLITPEPVTGGTPTASIDANPRFGVAPQEVVLDGRRSVGVFGRRIVSYEWTLGDEKTTGPTVTRTYPAGDYFVTLTVTDDAGEKGSASLVVRVAKTMSIGRPPVALASAEPTSGKAPLTVRFRGEAAALTGKVAGATWDFGDGEKSDQLEATHSYSKPGTYLATLTVRSDHDSLTGEQCVITVE